MPVHLGTPTSISIQITQILIKQRQEEEYLDFKKIEIPRIFPNCVGIPTLNTFYFNEKTIFIFRIYKYKILFYLSYPMKPFKANNSLNFLLSDEVEEIDSCTGLPLHPQPKIRDITGAFDTFLLFHINNDYIVFRILRIVL